MSLKMLREDLCRRQVQSHDWPQPIESAVDVLIAMIDMHRPLGNDGKHGDLHTPTCGCGGIVTATPAPRCGEQAWQPHDDPHCPPNPPSPVCRLAPEHDGPHEGRSIPHGTPLEWTETNGRVTRG